jgi:long-chain acyl-CoA synthetase
MSERTIRHYIDLRARECPQRTYLIAPETGRLVTYADLAREARNLTRFLLGSGLVRDDKVGLYLPNGLQTAVLFLGAMYGGFVAVPFNLLAQRSQLEYVLEHSEIKILFTTREQEAQVASALQAGRRGVEVIVIDPDAPSLFPEDNLPPVDPPQVAESDSALLIYTSGTTGIPKGCLHTHRSVVSGGIYASEAHVLSACDRVLSSLPLYHINGQIVATVAPLVHGGSVICPQRFSVSNFWQTLARYDATWFNVVPTIVSYLVAAAPDADASRGLDLSRVRFGRSASAPLPPELHREFERKFGFSIIETFGMTETCAPCFANPTEKSLQKYGSVGMPFGNVAKIARLDGSTCKPGEIGELMIKGDNVMLGYYKSPEETRKALEPDGWLHSGDLGYVDEEGYYFVTGRLKELIIKGGENIAPREIDDVLFRHPAVLEAAAVGVPDPHFGQEIMVGIVLKPGMHASEDDLRSFCEAELGRYKTPKTFRFLPELPKGPSGKVQRLKLLDH